MAFKIEFISLGNEVIEEPLGFVHYYHLTITEDGQIRYELLVPDWIGNNGVVKREYFVINPEHLEYKNGPEAMKIVDNVVKIYSYLKLQYSIDKIMRELKIDHILSLDDK